MKKILIGLIIITLTSCGKYPKGVAESLKLAGDGYSGSICASDFGVVCASDFGPNCAIIQ